MDLRINPNVGRLVCSASGQEVPSGNFETPVRLCTCCDPPKPVMVTYDPEKVRGELERFPHPDLTGPGIWKYAPLLPVLGVPEAYAGDVGLTPTMRCDVLSEELEAGVWLKNEGTNPSGSFKDRGLAVGIALGAASGARRFCLPTQGNAGVAASLFSRRLGLPGCLVYMPESWRGSIYHRACEFFGGEVRCTGANIADSGRTMRAELAPELDSGEYVDISTFFEPGRLEGKKTMGLEICETFGPEELPEFIVYPTGGGTGLVGIWKAFTELAEIGAIDPVLHRLPRMVAVQSANCAPVVESFRRGLDAVEPVTSQGTVADGLDVPGAIMGHRILGVLRESGGTAVSVSEDGIRASFARYGELGINAGYESAATLAALRLLRASGEIPAGSRVLLLNTGSHLLALARAAATA